MMNIYAGKCNRGFALQHIFSLAYEKFAVVAVEIAID